MSNSCGHGSEQRDDNDISRPAASHNVAPIVLMLKGHPGCGKSTLAAALACRLAWPLIDKDDAKDCLSGLPCDPAALNAVSYAIIFSVAATQLRCGNSVIVDCPLAREELWNKAMLLADQYGAHVGLVEILPPPDEVWRRRLEQRAAAEGNGAAGHKPNWKQLQKLIQGYAECFNWPCNQDWGGTKHWVIVHSTDANPGAEKHDTGKSQCCLDVDRQVDRVLSVMTHEWGVLGDAHGTSARIERSEHTG